MKKLILTPQKDTITICIPGDWVGKQIVCILQTEEKPTQEATLRKNRVHYTTVFPDSPEEKKNVL